MPHAHMHMYEIISCQVTWHVLETDDDHEDNDKPITFSITIKYKYHLFANHHDIDITTYGFPFGVP